MSLIKFADLNPTTSFTSSSIAKGLKFLKGNAVGEPDEQLLKSNSQNFSQKCYNSAVMGIYQGLITSIFYRFRTSRSGNNVNCSNDGNDVNSLNDSTAGKIIEDTSLASTASGVITTAAISIVKGLGFASSGILKDSIVIGVQSGIENMAARSTFATLQSLVAKGVIENNVNSSNDGNDVNSLNDSTTGKIIEDTSLALTASGAITAVASSTIKGLGFASSGILKGSIAAAVQSGIGNVAAGSTFATLQSLGAKGVIVTVGTTGVVLLAVGGAGYGGYRLYKWYKSDEL